jgi:amidase
MELIELSVAELAELVSNKEISAYELTEAYIDRIEKVNPKINAIVQFNPEGALDTARKLDELQANGELLGPLHGVPFTLKDVYNTKDDIVTAGTLGLKDNIATEDATIVKRLRAGGGILLGKTNTPEFENGADTDNLVYGKTLNPYGLSRSAGGSSGGAAASVAACCSAFDIGADTGGSLRVPAHYCGISTIRSSPRRVPTTSVVYGFRTGLGGYFTTDGPLTRHVADLELILQIIQGPDGIDPNTIAVPLEAMDKTDYSKLRIAYFDDDGNSAVTKDVKSAVKTAAGVLENAGSTIHPDCPPRLGDGFRIFQELLGANLVAGYESAFERLKVKERSPLIQKLMDHCAKFTCDLRTIMKRWDEWEYFRADILKFFQEYDALICPVTAQEAISIEKTMFDPDMIDKISYSWEVSATLLPAAVVRAGTTKEGLPIGVQIITKPYREDVALSIAKQIENALGGWIKPNLA